MVCSIKQIYTCQNIFKFATIKKQNSDTLRNTQRNTLWGKNNAGYFFEMSFILVCNSVAIIILRTCSYSNWLEYSWLGVILIHNKKKTAFSYAV
jgi:hypothetical protein